MATYDRIRASDADRERVTTRLRDHYAEGRLTRDELDERVTAALNATTFGDLHRVMTDLPEPELVPAQARGLPRTAAPGPVLMRRGPRIMPLALLALLVALLSPAGGWILLMVLPALLVLSLVVLAAPVLAAARSRRRIRHWQPGHGYYQHWRWPGAYSGSRW